MVGETKGGTLYPECDFRLHIPTRFPKAGEPTRRINLGDALLLAFAFYEEQETRKSIQKYRESRRNRYKAKIGRELIENMGRPTKHQNEETQKSLKNYQAYRKRRYTKNIEQPLKAEV
jgi:hypothetical protein